MVFDENSKVWMNGEFVLLKDAKINVLSHVVHYGSSVFEGLRSYENSKGIAIFRLEDHVNRLFESAKIYKMEIPFTKEDISEAIKETIKINNLKSSYIRPIAYRGFSELGVNPRNIPIDVAIGTWEWGSYIGEEQMENGANVGISSWRKPSPDTFPARAKAGANYMNSQLAILEAHYHGYDEAILLDYNGNVAEGSGENLFIVEGDKIITPDLSSILKGITRDCALKIAKDLGYKVFEETITRDRLYLADEAFFTGSAAEITPIRSVDHRIIGEGKLTVSKEIRKQFYDIINNKVEDKYDWLTYI